MESVTVYDGESSIIQVTAKLVIKNFVRVMSVFEPGMCFESDKFTLGDTDWTIKVYPNGFKEEFRGNVSVFLSNKTDADVNVICHLVTDVKTTSCDNTKPLKANKLRGQNTFATHAICTEAYQEKDFVVTAKVEAPGQNVKVIGKQSAAPSKKRKFNVLENVYTKMQRTDFTLVFDGEEVPCHKHILAAASSALEAMVENKHREAIEGKANMKLSEEVGRAFVRFIYTGSRIFP